MTTYNTLIHDNIKNKEDIAGINEQLAERAKYIVPTGSSDDTTMIQTALNSYSSVIAKAGTYFIDTDISVVLNNNNTLTFEKGAILKAKPTSNDHYEMLKIIDVENVEINGGLIIGERNEHIGTTGEWGYGIEIRGSKNVTLNNTNIKDCWGDGIVLGKKSSLDTKTNENIILNNVVCDNNRRQGISVSTVKGLWINGGYLKNTNGTSPQAGIDFEPDAPTGILQDIWISGLKTENNAGAGVKIYIAMLDSTSQFININIINHVDIGSNNGFHVAGGNSVLSGLIKNDSPYYRDSKYAGINIADYGYQMPRIEIVKPQITNCNTSGSTNSRKYSSGVTIIRELNSINNVQAIGNVHIFEPKIEDIRTSKLMMSAIYLLDEKNNNIDEISIINPIKIDYGTNSSRITLTAKTIRLIDQNRVLTRILSTNEDLATTNIASFITTANLPGARTLTLNPDLPIEYEFTIEVQKNQVLTIKPPTTEQILPLGTGLGKSIFSPITLGASITLRKISSTQWIIKNMIGNWTFES